MALHRLYDRLYDGSTIARQSPYDRLYKRLCTVSTNGYASSLRPALRWLYNRPYIAHTIVCTDVSTIISAIVYNGSTNDSANGSTIAHTIVHTNGSTTALPRLYSGSTNGSTSGSTNGSTASY